MSDHPDIQKLAAHLATLADCTGNYMLAKTIRANFYGAATCDTSSAASGAASPTSAPMSGDQPSSREGDGKGGATGAGGSCDVLDLLGNLLPAIAREGEIDPAEDMIVDPFCRRVHAEVSSAIAEITRLRASLSASQQRAEVLEQEVDAWRVRPGHDRPRTCYAGDGWDDIRAAVAATDAMLAEGGKK
jgi:hypothetical protein